MLQELTLNEVLELSKVLHASKLFDVMSAEQAAAKIMLGQELGVGPIASMSGIYIQSGKMAMHANLMSALIKKSPRYNFRVKELTAERCELVFLEDGKEVGVSSFSMEDARKAGVEKKAIYSQFPRNLLFARAISNGAKWYCADVFGGQTPYVPEELGSADAERDAMQVVVDIPESKEDAVKKLSGALAEKPMKIIPAKEPVIVKEPEKEPVKETPKAVAPKDTDLLGDNKDKFAQFKSMASSHGYDAEQPQAMSNLCKLVGITKPAMLPYGKAKLLVAYMQSQTGKSGAELAKSKELGKVILDRACATGEDWATASSNTAVTPTEKAVSLEALQ